MDVSFWYWVFVPYCMFKTRLTWSEPLSFQVLLNNEKYSYQILQLPVSMFHFQLLRKSLYPPIFSRSIVSLHTFGFILVSLVSTTVNVCLRKMYSTLLEIRKTWMMSCLASIFRLLLPCNICLRGNIALVCF